MMRCVAKVSDTVSESFKGVYKHNNGNVYKGDFKRNKRKGKGTLTYKNGDVYKGEFKDNKVTGYGKMKR